MKKHPLLQIHLAALLFGGAGLFGKFLALPPVTITLGRTVFGALALGVAARVLRVSLCVRSRRDLLCLFFGGALLAVHWFTFFHSIQVSSVAIGLLSFSSFPVFVLFLEPLLFRERFRTGDLPLVGLVVAGLALMTTSLQLSDHATQGLLWGIASGFSFALLSLLNRAQVQVFPPLAVAFYQNAFAAFCLVPLVQLSAEVWSSRSLGLLLVLGVVFTAGAQVLYLGSLRHLRTHAASVIICLEPVYGLVLAWFLLAEWPAGRTLAGGALILGGVVAATLRHAQGSTPAG